MAISEQDFNSAERGDHFLDCHSRRCEIQRKNKQSLLIQIPGYPPEIVRWFQGGIVDEEFGYIIELKHSSARLVKKAS